MCNFFVQPIEKLCHGCFSIFIHISSHHCHLHLFIIVLHTFRALHKSLQFLVEVSIYSNDWEQTSSSLEPSFLSMFLLVSLYLSSYSIPIYPTTLWHNQWTLSQPTSPFMYLNNYGSQRWTPFSSSTPNIFQDHSSLENKVFSFLMLLRLPSIGSNLLWFLSRLSPIHLFLPIKKSYSSSVSPLFSLWKSSSSLPPWFLLFHLELFPSSDWSFCWLANFSSCLSIQFLISPNTTFNLSLLLHCFKSKIKVWWVSIIFLSICHFVEPEIEMLEKKYSSLFLKCLHSMMKLHTRALLSVFGFFCIKIQNTLAFFLS